MFTSIKIVICCCLLTLFSFDVKGATYTLGISGSQSATITATSGAPDKLYDDGGVGSDYSDNVNATYTFNCAGGKYVRLKVNSLDTESGWDYFTVYDGNSTAARPMGFLSYSGSYTNYMYVATSGSLTVKFESDGSSVFAGWDIDVWIDDYPGQRWIGGTDANVSTLANWEGSVLPKSATNIYIPSGTTFNPTLSNSSSDLSVANIHVVSGATFVYSSTSNLSKLYLWGNLLIDGTFNHSGNQYIETNGGFSTDYATISGSGTYSTILLMLGNDIWDVYYKISNNSTLAEIYLDNSNGDSRFDMNTYNLTTSSITIESGTTFYQRTGTLSTDQTTPTIDNTSFQEATGTTSFTKSGAQTIPAITYYNFATSGNNTKTFGGNVDVNGTFTIGNSTTVATANNNLTLAGNWTNNGTFTCGTGTVTFDGAAAQSISGSSSTTFHGFTMNNSSATGVTLGVNTTINNTLTLTDGLLYTATYTLTLGTNASNATVASGSSDSYIVAYNDGGGNIGYVKQFVNTAASTTYNFPIGEPTGKFTPLTFTLVSAGALANANLIVHTKGSKIDGMNAAVTQYIARHWIVTESGFTTPTYNISYVYLESDIVGTETGLKPVKLSTVGWDWYKPSGTTFTSGIVQGTSTLNTTSNTLGWNSLTTFSKFGGAVDGGVALPVELYNFEVSNYHGNVKLNWKTSTEIDNDHFVIERSDNGNEFEFVNQVKGAGNSNYPISYFLIDDNYFKGINYYRLIMVDFNGTTSISPVLSIDMSKNEGGLVIMTVNSIGQEVNQEYRGVVFDIYSDGSSIKRIQ